jgi:hypothetical protein
MASVPSHPLWVQREQALALLLSERGLAIVPVAAGDTSMVPHLSGGDAVLAVPIAAAPGPGDLLVFRQHDYFVVHRCLGRATSRDGRRGLRTRGDGRNVLDPHVLPEDVRAKVVALRRAGSWRSLEGPKAHIYARMIAWHDLFWAATGFVARKVGLGRVAALVDLGLLRVLVPLAFPAFHRRIPPPDGASPSQAV